MDEKCKLAMQAYRSGYNCSQAVFCVFAQEMGMNEETAYRIMEGFGGGIGAMQEVCGAFCAAAAVISYFTSNGKQTGTGRAKTYRAVRRAAELYAQEYGSIRCREILRGNAPKALQCGKKVEDAVLLVQKVLAENAEK